MNMKDRTMFSSSQPTADVHQPPSSLHGTTNYVVESNVQTQNEMPLHKYVNAIRVVGIMEIILGSISNILGIVTVTIVSKEVDELENANANAASTHPLVLVVVGLNSQGLWCGVMVLITGIIGMTLKQHATRCLHIASMVCSMTCFVIALAALISSIIMLFLSIIIISDWIPAKLFVGNHATLFVIIIMILIVTIVHVCFCCKGACYQRASEGNLATAYLPQHNAGFVQDNLDATSQSGGTLPHAQFAPVSATVDNKPSNAESQPTTYEEPVNVTWVVSNSHCTGYEARNLTVTIGENAMTPYAPYTPYEQSNRTDPEPDRYPSRPTAHHWPLTTPTVVSPVGHMAMKGDDDYVEPNQIEYGQVPDAGSRDSNQVSETSIFRCEKSERSALNTDAAYLSLT